jgi:hypothetical protein
MLYLVGIPVAPVEGKFLLADLAGGKGVGGEEEEGHGEDAGGSGELHGDGVVELRWSCDSCVGCVCFELGCSL